MNEKIIKEMAKTSNINQSKIEVVLKLLEDGNTIPFIARYRKEATGGLNEILIKEIKDKYDYELNLLKRKEDIIRLIDEKGMLTEELKNKILAVEKLVEVEDIYRPYKEKKETKALIAINNGLEGLAKIIMSFPLNKTVFDIASKYRCLLDDTSLKLEGAKDIIKEYIQDNAYYRKWIRNFVFNTGFIFTKLKKNAVDDEKVFSMYYDFNEKITYLKSHRYLAINRGEDKKVLTVSIKVDDEKVLDFLASKIIKNSSSLVCDFVKEAIKEAYKKSIFPSIEREIRSELFDKAKDISIKNFSSNLSNLLLTPPIKQRRVLGFDPAFRTGCKLACLDEFGNVLDIAVIYPHEPKCEFETSKNIVLSLIEKYHLDIVAIGNGTASRESEAFIAEVLKDSKYPCKYVIVNEAGASVYSASSLAINEFPNLDVSERSAISIGRRLQDPLAELVKIDPKSIGVGLYQHDVKSKELDEALTFTVESIVNQVGVNINTASICLLSYLSGINKKCAQEIISYRKKVGKITSREILKEIKGITSKVYEQAIGFIRIYDGKNPLDKTNIHPDNYPETYEILKKISCTLDDLGTDLIKEKINNLDILILKDELKIDEYTLKDILESLKKPILDPRDELKKPILKSDILTIDDLSVGMMIEGIVRNVVDFGAFIDIGLKNDALVHISQITKSYIKHPSEILKIGDIVTCYVLLIDKEKKKVNLTLIKN